MKFNRILIAILALIFVGLAIIVQNGTTQAFDESVLLSLREPSNLSLPIGPSWLQDPMRDISALGSGAVLTLLSIASVSLLLINRRYRIGLYVAVTIISGQILNGFLKHAFHRLRPEVVPHLSHVSTMSFPSGHSMMSALVYVTLGLLAASTCKNRSLGLFAVCLSTIIVVLVGMSRVYLGVHYPTDVLAGWLAGWCWAIGAREVAQRAGHLLSCQERTDSL